MMAERHQYLSRTPDARHRAVADDRVSPFAPMHGIRGAGLLMRGGVCLPRSNRSVVRLRSAVGQWPLG